MPQFDRPTILMCPPDHYGIEYEINPWMNRSRQCDRSLAELQWQQLRDVLASVGADIRLMEPVKGLPDLVFTANAALMWRDRAYLARFRHSARQPETTVDAAWFQAAGFETRELPLGWDFEGAGDAFFAATHSSPDTSFAAMSAASIGWRRNSAAESSRCNWSATTTITSTPASARSAQPRQSISRRHSTNMDRLRCGNTFRG